MIIGHSFTLYKEKGAKHVSLRGIEMMKEKWNKSHPKAEQKMERAVLGMLFSLAWPTILESLLETILQYVDTAMVGRLGAQATARASSTMWRMW